MQAYSTLRNDKELFVLANTAVRSSSIRLDDKPNVKTNESSEAIFYPFILPFNKMFNGFWDDIKNTTDISFDHEDAIIPPGFLNTADYIIKKPLLSSISTVPAFKLDAVTDVDIKQCARLKAMLQEEITEGGIVNPSEKIIESLYSEDRQKTNILLNKLFIENFRNTHIMVGVLHIISHFDYDIVSPEGPTMAIAALSHQDVEAREYGVKCFENWQHKDGIKILENVKANERWLQNYIELVLHDLKTRG